MEPETKGHKPTSLIRSVGKLIVSLVAGLAIEIVGFILVVAVVILIFVVKDYFQPKATVWQGTEITQEHVAVANNAGALNPGETIDCFYQADRKSTDEWFCMVTDKRVVLYDKSNPQSPIRAIDLDHIILRDINHQAGEMIYIMARDGAMIHLFVSTEDQCDEKFFDAIEDGMKRVGNDPWQKSFKFEWSF